ncbi:MAG: hypothetical protein FGM62_04075 [Methylobacterium sp.]|nr:hypothetical protein [Methylobacterium sp.]
MAGITVKALDANTFEVTVVAGSTTTHVVSVSADYAAGLSGGNASREELVRRSFEFLLEREPNTSILRRFDLPVIARYFREYERVIKTMR